MALRNRQTLKNSFEKGKMPTQAHFEDFIDSTVNIVEDGFSKDMDNGLMIAPAGESQKLVTFFKNIEHKNAAWCFEMGGDKNEPGLNITNQKGISRLFIHPEGMVGVGTVEPVSTLHVNGMVAAKARMGVHYGQVLAKGRWRKIVGFQHLKGCHALEIVARVGKTGSGRYALMHAIAISTFGRSHDIVHKHQAYYGAFWNKLALRWVGDTNDFGLEIKTRSDYGDGVYIQYHITRLWSDSDYSYLFKKHGAAMAQNEENEGKNV